MAKCKCTSNPRIVSKVVQSMNNCQTRDGTCGDSKCPKLDVCANPICGEPNKLSLFAPLIYDEIGINLCTTLDLDMQIKDNYPTASSATIQVLKSEFDYGEDGVQIAHITGRPNCYLVTLSQITLNVAVSIYDSDCKWLDTFYSEITYLPEKGSENADPDTNPSSVELEIFAPYGLSYDMEDGIQPIVNFIGFNKTENTIAQGLNLYAILKILDFTPNNDMITVGATLVLQSLYYAGYKVESAGKLHTPKGSIVSPEESDCMKFVAGDLLNLAIKPLDLGRCSCEEKLKKPEKKIPCGGECNSGAAATSTVDLFVED